MPRLTLTGVSDDGSDLQLVDDDGEAHVLEITDDLRTAVHPGSSTAGSTSPSGPSGRTAGTDPSTKRAAGRGRSAPKEAGVNATTYLRPREIQSRIRSGETAESVAEAARTTVEKIMPFAGPVLAERQHVADRAQRSNLRRTTGDPGTTRTLGSAVEGNLRTLNIPQESLDWDAWRREDGRWTLEARLDAAERTSTARFSFDPRGNFVTLDDDEARWLVGDLAPAATEEPADDDLSAVRRRRLTAVPPGAEAASGVDESALTRHPAGSAIPAGTPTATDVVDDDLGDDAIGMVHGEATTGRAHPEPTLDALLPLTPDLEPASAERAGAAERVDEPSGDAPEGDDTDEQRRKRASKRRGRTSVPSWDEIMFGGADS